jgi:monoamine oxidase
VVFADGTKQTCHFDSGHYQNFGPGRLPSNHKTMLGYCRKLGVQLEVEINTSRSSLLQNDAANGGKPVVQRQAINDTRGHVSELLSKCIRAGALDAEMTKNDLARMLTFLHTYGPLDKGEKYIGSERAGYSVLPGAGEDDGVNSVPLSMQMLLDEDFWYGMLYEEENDWQATMFQPVGGMDHIPHAFAKALGPIVQYNSPVTELLKMPRGVLVAYMQNGEKKAIEADFCICAMPLVPLRKVRHNLSAAHRKVVEECTYDSFYKVAWESRRFWEQDYNIYGGLEFVSTGCSPVWLPSAGLFTPRGVLVSGYDQAGDTPFGKLPLQQKFAASRASVEKLHPGHGRELEKPLYVGWGEVPYIEGAWVGSYGPQQPYVEPEEVTDLGHRRGGEFANTGYTTLLQPDGPIYFAGDHVSYLVGWQEGAALSSIRAVNMLGEKVKAARLAGVKFGAAG